MKWTNDQIEKVKCLLKEGNTFKSISSSLDISVTPKAVQVKMHKLGIYYSDYKESNVEDITCFECQTGFSAKKWEKRKFCSRKCSAGFNSRGVDRHKKSRGNKEKRIIPKFCLYCKIDFSAFTGKKYCSRNCQQEYHLEKRIESGKYSAKVAKRYLLKHQGHKCSTCQLETWQNKPIPIELDHINGKSDNHSLDNLRLLCNNCHAQTPTYKNKNAGNGRQRRRKRYQEGKSW